MLLTKISKLIRPNCYTVLGLLGTATAITAPSENCFKVNSLLQLATEITELSVKLAYRLHPRPGNANVF